MHVALAVAALSLWGNAASNSFIHSRAFDDVPLDDGAWAAARCLAPLGFGQKDDPYAIGDRVVTRYEFALATERFLLDPRPGDPSPDGHKLSPAAMDALKGLVAEFRTELHALGDGDDCLDKGLQASESRMGWMFTDVPRDHWAWQAAEALYVRGFRCHDEYVRGRVYATRYEFALGIERFMIRPVFASPPEPLPSLNSFELDCLARLREEFRQELRALGNGDDRVDAALRVFDEHELAPCTDVPRDNWACDVARTLAPRGLRLRPAGGSADTGVYTRYEYALALARFLFPSDVAGNPLPRPRLSSSEYDCLWQLAAEFNGELRAAGHTRAAVETGVQAFAPRMASVPPGAVAP